MRYVVLILVVVASPWARGEDSIAVLRIKAAFLYKFASYVEWPDAAFADAASPIVIGIVGPEILSQELVQAVARRRVGARGMQVLKLGGGDRVAGCCQILFIGAASAGERQVDLLAQTYGRPVLTVTDAEAEHPRGSVINFQLVENRVRFDIAREAAEQNGLQLRSQLLAVARQVSSP